jgi:hypothetical protein
MLPDACWRPLNSASLIAPNEPPCSFKDINSEKPIFPFIVSRIEFKL